MAGGEDIDDRDLARRLSYLGLGAEDGERLRVLADGAAESRGRFIERFYAELARFTGPSEAIARSRWSMEEMQACHGDQLLGLLGGRYDLDYAQGRKRVGIDHHRAGLEPEWFIGAYRHYLEWLLPVILKVSHGDAPTCLNTVLSLVKVILLDIELAVNAYFHADHDKLRLLAKVFESDMEAVLIADPQGRIAEANHMTALISGYRPDDLVGRSVAMLFSAREEATFDGIWAVAATAGTWHGEVWHGHADGYDYLARMSVAAVRDDKGVAIHYVVEYSDATEAWEAEQALKARTEELNRSNMELEQFAYVASHDLQEPLRMVASYTQLLARRYKGRLDQDADDFIGFAVDGATRMQGLINDLLKFSRVGTRGRPFVPVEGERVLADALANLHVAVGESGGVISHDKLPRLVGDPTQLTQLFQNLVGNALKFRRPDVEPAIHVGVSHTAEGWQFSVRDNGIGISPEYFERIFVIFQRLHGKGEYPGTGIGLALCKKIVERHGGRIWVESRPGEGATFHFTIPDREDGGNG